MTASRASGLLLHPTSLPGPPGIGDLGPAALGFLQTLHGAGQSLWQVLPLGPTGYGDSPYQTLSAFAGNPLLIAPEVLKEEGLLTAKAVAAVSAGAPDRVDFGAVIAAKTALLQQAWKAFDGGAGSPELREDWAGFREREQAWLEDWTLFAALHDRHRKSWVDWPRELAGREEKALETARSELSREIKRHAFSQFLFFRQWDAVRARATELGIRVFGDLPLFVAHDSADVWAHPDLFDLDEQGHPLRLSGAPPDVFTDDGQLWGNPLYRWDALEKSDFAWWVDRVRAAFRLFDLVRIDHFRGFAACWASPAGETTARNGQWDPVPGAKLFEVLQRELGELAFVAEDLGEITPDVNELRDRFGFPGMRILLFGFGGDPNENTFALFNHERNSVVYTGTHDNETVCGWFRDGIYTSMNRPKKEAEEERARVLTCTGTDGSEIHWDFIRLAMLSVADTVVVPVQDVLGLGNEARMNFPGTQNENWVWRLAPDQWTDEHSRRLVDLARATGRTP
ncbi:MAG: 4-alpha-glucanotransferase [Gemmatimonadota bacterium]|nr:MAG: 4-alpha-glucanotransferase [Gemmatimonadota bacterium]